MANFLNLFDFFKKNNNQKKCKYLSSSLFFDAFNNISVCPYKKIGVFQENFDGLWFDVERFKSFNKDNYDKIVDDCFSCEYHSSISKNNGFPLKSLHLSNWKNCYINCCYCNSPKIEDLIQAGHYDVFPVIKQLLDANIIGKQTQIVFECGDATIHPEFDKIMYFFINYGMKNIVINTPALRYCESISEAIGKNIAKVIISFDSGCPYIYERIKGINKFDISVSNLKKYLASQEPKEKRVILKYTILNGVNDNQKEILDWYMMARDFGVKKLAIDVESNWYNQIKNSVPQHLKDILLFANNMSKYNDIEIEFYDRADIILKSAK